MSSHHYIKPAVRRAVMARAQRRCEDCGERYPLELHHVTYENVPNETPDDLLALCRGCHHGKHTFMGDFYADPQVVQELKDAWAHAMEKMTDSSQFQQIHNKEPLSCQQ